MRFWFDTEFYENGSAIVPISLGAVAEDGREYYTEFPLSLQAASRNEWLKTNVLPYLKGTDKSYSQIRGELIGFFGEKPEIWAYYADYDWVLLCQLFGTMMDLPKGWPMWCRDVKQLCWTLGDPSLPAQLNEHHALADAKWTKEAWEWLQKKSQDDYLWSLRKENLNG